MIVLAAPGVMVRLRMTTPFPMISLTVVFKTTLSMITVPLDSNVELVLAIIFEMLVDPVARKRTGPPLRSMITSPNTELLAVIVFSPPPQTNVLPLTFTLSR
ncbi:hypothetical protein D3C76_1528650 [compost metagenome]